MQKRKVCVVVTARPSYSRIKSALRAIQDRSDLELDVIVAGSALLDNYGRTDTAIEKEGFRVAARVYMIVEGGNLVNMSKTAGLGLIELGTAINNVRPDVVVTIADRYETIATALAAAYMNIPLVHIQGGEITGSIDEKIRHAITKLADLHFVSTKKAGERVVKMGEDPKAVFVTGCPSIDLAAHVKINPRLDFDPFAKYGGVGLLSTLAPRYIVLMQHPVTTEYAQARAQILETLHAVKHFNLPVLCFWPNVDAGTDGTSDGIRSFRELEKPNLFRFFKNMSEVDFLRLIVNSACLVGNSSVAIREGSYLGVPAVNIGTRQTGRERGANAIDANYDRNDIHRAIENQLKHAPYSGEDLYGGGDAGERIAKLLATETLRVNKRLTY